MEKFEIGQKILTIHGSEGVIYSVGMLFGRPCYGIKDSTYGSMFTVFHVDIIRLLF